LKHALDFRLMSDQRVAILDASHSLFDVQTRKGLDEVDQLVLQPIPQFRDIVSDTVRTVLDAGNFKLGKVAVIDVGVICDTIGVAMLTRLIHVQVLKKLESGTRTS